MHQDVLSYFWDVNFVVSSQIPWGISVHVFITSVAEVLACSLTSVLGVKMIYVSLHGTFKHVPDLKPSNFQKLFQVYTYSSFQLYFMGFLILVLISEKILLP